MMKQKKSKLKARILAVHKAHSSLQTIFRSKQIHRNNQISLHIVLINPVLCYGSLTWVLPHMTEQMLCTFERKVLRRIYGPIQDKGRLHPRWNSDIYNLYNYHNIVGDIKIRRLGWAGHIITMEDGRVPKGFLMGNFLKKTIGKTKNKMVECRSEGYITDLGSTRTEETSRRQRRIEASAEGVRGPEGAVAP